MAQGLNVSRLVNVNINLSPIAAARRGFGTLLLVGDSDVINVSERIRSYTDIEGVAADFGSQASEYLAAQLYFGQSPRPRNLMIGRWARTNTSAVLRGGILTAAEQNITNFTAISTGSMVISIDGTPQTVTALSLATVTNLNQVASALQAKLTGATVTWTGSRFEIRTTSTGSSAVISYASAHTSGTDVSALFKLTSTTALTPIAGIAAETPLAAVQILAGKSDWYGLSFAASTQPTISDLLLIASYIESASIARVFGVTETNTLALDSTYTTDIASQFKAGDYRRSLVQYSANKFAVASLLGRMFSVDFTQNRSTITLMYKQEPSVVPELLTETQASVLKTKRCNVFVTYSNDTSIIQDGVMSGSAWADEIHGLDWLSDAIQNNLYNALYTSTTKIPQTDAGQTQLLSVVVSALDEAVNNGLVAAGMWTADGFGELKPNTYLDRGYYVYSPPMALQAQADREARKSPPIQIAVKLAGAIHTVDVTINVNR